MKGCVGLFKQIKGSFKNGISHTLPIVIGAAVALSSVIGLFIAGAQPEQNTPSVYYPLKGAVSKSGALVKDFYESSDWSFKGKDFGTGATAFETESEDFSKPAAETAEDGMDPGKDLFHFKRLDDIVVGTALQAHDLVSQFALGGEHDDGGAVLLPDLFQHAPAVQHGEHDIQQHQIGLEGAEKLHTLAAVQGNGCFKPLFFQIEVQQFGNVGFVFDDEYFSSH